MSSNIQFLGIIKISSSFILPGIGISTTKSDKLVKISPYYDPQFKNVPPLIQKEFKMGAPITIILLFTLPG